MKKLLLLLLPLWSMAQTFPYDEGFHNTVSGTLPAGWEGDMKVYADHGVNDMKGMAADLSSLDVEDSAITPWIGPLDNNTEFYFWYRIVNQNIYPSTEKNLQHDGRLVISYSTDSVNYFPYYTIDSANHTSSLGFRRIVFPVTTLGGQTVKFKFWCNFDGGSSYYIDIDSIKIRPSTGLSVNNLQSPDFSLFPNPVNVGTEVQLVLDKQATNQYITVYDAMGRVMVLQNAQQSSRFISTENFAPGIYFVSYADRTKKLVIE